MEPVDPVVVLPPEMLREVCSYLRPDDLARLFELSSGWRLFAGDEALWRGVVLDLRATAADSEVAQRWPSPGALRVLRRAPCLAGIHFGGRPIPDLVAELLAEEGQVRVSRLLGLRASPAALALLRRLGPQLEELQLVHPTKEHLEAVAGMEALRALDLDLDMRLMEGQRVYLRLQKLEHGRQQLRLAAQNPAALAGLLAQEPHQGAVVHANEGAQQELPPEVLLIADKFINFGVGRLVHDAFGVMAMKSEAALAAFQSATSAADKDRVAVGKARVTADEAMVSVREAQAAYDEAQATADEALRVAFDEADGYAAKEALVAAKGSQAIANAAMVRLQEALGVLQQATLAYEEALEAHKTKIGHVALEEVRVASLEARAIVDEALPSVLEAMDAIQDALQAVRMAQVTQGSQLTPQLPAGLLVQLRNQLALHPLGRSLLHQLEQMLDLEVLEPQAEAVLAHGLQAILAGLQTATVAPLVALLGKHFELPSLPSGLHALRIRSPCLPASWSRAIQGMESLRRLSLTRPPCSADSDSSLWDSDRSEQGLPPQLEELEVECVGLAQLESVRGMASLRTLTLLGSLPAGVVFVPPPPGHRGLRVVGLDEASCREESALSLLRAHAATLEELQLLCEPCPDPDLLPPHEALMSLTARLRQLLHRRGPSALRRLVLRRQSSCADESACRAQLQALREDLKALCVHVACSKCG